jgi:hypothetical protein
MTCARLALGRKRRVPPAVVDAARRARSIEAVLAAFGFLAWGCGGNVAGNGPVDASSGADGSVGTTVDASRDGEGGSVETDTLDGAGGEGRPTACTSPDDCILLGSPLCCLAKVCVSYHPDDCTDANVQLIQASSYNQSCTRDSDCIAVAEGNGCLPGAFDCTNAAISKGAYAQYTSDIAKTQSALCLAPSNCGLGFGPCCRDGKCQMGSGCSSPADTLPSCADAGGTCMPNVITCGTAGPPDACAYSDEMCCLN